MQMNTLTIIVVCLLVVTEKIFFVKPKNYDVVRSKRKVNAKRCAEHLPTQTNWRLQVFSTVCQLWARETVDLLTRETPDFIPPTLLPPNSPDLNPVDYKLWSVVHEKVYKGRIKDVDELRSHILTAWDELDQRVIDTAVRQWRTRLRACVKAIGRHFEHKLSQ